MRFASSEDLSFLIEERSIASIAYSTSSSPTRYDDLDYTFNFEARYAGESANRRIASQLVDFEADKDYTFLIGGSVASPTLTVWTGNERTFDAADTVFEARFAHASASLGALDYYFADPAVVPAIGNQVATLSYGELAPATDFTEGDYVLTVTLAGDPGAAMFVSETTAFAAQDAVIIPAFDGNANTNAPMLVRAFGASGSGFALPDSRFPPTAEFVNAAMELGTSDVFDDEMLTSKRVADFAYRDVSDEIEIASGENTFYFTPAGDTTAITLQNTFSATGGTRYRVIAVGGSGLFSTRTFTPDRRSVETAAKLVPFQTSNNYDFLDVYAIPPDSTIDDEFAVRPALITREASTSVALAAGTYDLYVTNFGEKVPLAGPFRVDVTLGDIVDIIIVDSDDPQVLEVLFLSGGPQP